MILLFVSPAGLYWTLLLEAGDMDIEPETSLLPIDPGTPTAVCTRASNKIIRSEKTQQHPLILDQTKRKYVDI